MKESTDTCRDSETMSWGLGGWSFAPLEADAAGPGTTPSLARVILSILAAQRRLIARTSGSAPAETH